MRRPLLAAAALLVAASSPALAQPPAAQRATAADSAARARVEQELVTVVREMGEAFNRRDVAGVLRHLATEYVSVEPDGREFDRENVAARATNNPPGFKATEQIREVSVRLAGADSAAMTYRSDLRMEGLAPQPVTMASRTTTTFVRRGGRWVIVRSEHTPLRAGS
jgi:ketosteroid isomerase-like protein